MEAKQDITLPLADVHMHVIPAVDDGSDSFETSLLMLKSAYEQGVRAVICTPHGGCFYRWKSRMTVKRNFRKLCEICRTQLPDLKLYPGAEVRFTPGRTDEAAALLKSGKMPTLAGSRYVMAEFENRGMTFENALYAVYRLTGAGFIPVIAHMERYPDLFDIKEAERLHESGCLIQINTESLLAPAAGAAGARADLLLREQLADLIGSDAHNMSARPPQYRDAVRILYEKYDSSYVGKLISGNAFELILKGK